MANCEQQALDGNWELNRTNACHIGVLNSEMGEVRNELIAMNLKMDLIFGGWGLIVATIVIVLIRKLFTKTK